MIRRVNRKKRSAEGYVVPLPFVAIVALASLLCLVYLWLCGQNEAVGREIKTLETRRKEAQKNCRYEAAKLIRMKSPEEMEKALRRCNLDMTWPSRDQIMRLSASDLARTLQETHSGGNVGRGRDRRVALNE